MHIQVSIAYGDNMGTCIYIYTFYNPYIWGVPNIQMGDPTIAGLSWKILWNWMISTPISENPHIYGKHSWKTDFVDTHYTHIGYYKWGYIIIYHINTYYYVYIYIHL